MKAKKIVDNLAKDVRDGMNVTPRIVLKEPVAKKDLKAVLDEIFRFVSVGGDFV